MAKALQGLSAKDFRIPLLRCLGTKISFDSGVTVDHEEIYAPVFLMMNITRDQFGMSDKTPWTVKWTQWAFQALCDEGLGERHGRGKWGLTVNGVTEARTMIQNNVLPTNAQDDAAALADAILADFSDLTPVVMIAPKVDFDDGMYHPDPYIRELALEDHTCLGFFSTQSPLCPTCPARTICQTRMLDRMAVVATGLDRDDTQASIADAIEPNDQEDDTVGSIQPPMPTKFKKPKGATYILQTCQSQTVCGHCRGTILVGDNAVWLRNVSSTVKSMMLHEGCFDE